MPLVGEAEEVKFFGGVAVSHFAVPCDGSSKGDDPCLVRVDAKAVFPKSGFQRFSEHSRVFFGFTANDEIIGKADPEVSSRHVLWDDVRKPEVECFVKIEVGKKG